MTLAREVLEKLRSGDDNADLDAEMSEMIDVNENEQGSAPETSSVRPSAQS